MDGTGLLLLFDGGTLSTDQCVFADDDIEWTRAKNIVKAKEEGRSASHMQAYSVGQLMMLIGSRLSRSNALHPILPYPASML